MISVVKKSVGLSFLSFLEKCDRVKSILASNRGQDLILHELKNKRRELLGVELLPPLVPKRRRGKGAGPFRMGISEIKDEGVSVNVKQRD